MSNIIRRSRRPDGEVQPFTPSPIASEKLTEPAWVGQARNVIRNRSDAALAVQTFALFEPLAAALQEPERPPADGKHEAMSLPAEEPHPTMAPVEIAAPTLPLPDLPDPVALLQQAQEEADRCLAEAHDQASSLQSQGYAEGFKQGEEAGHAAIAEQWAPVLASFVQATHDITRLRAEVVRQAEEDIVTLAFQLARKILRQEARYPRDILHATLRRALAYVGNHEHLVVRVHPRDLELAQAMQKDLLQGVDGVRHLTLEGDATVGRGGCVVASVFGEVDARLEAQLEELEGRFREQYPPATEEHAV